MSIVERALQKAQAKAKARHEVASVARAEPHGSAVESTAATATPEEPATVPARPRRPAQQVEASVATLHDDELGLTSRDLKKIVSIDVEALRAAGRLPTVEMTRQTDDEIRRIKWPLLKSITGSEGVAPARNNVVLVTSALPGEGKTFTSLNLALSIVRDREMRVVLVDGDVARPGLTPSLGLDNHPGLNDALEDADRDIGSVTYQTDVEGLFFVPAGTWNAHSPEFFAGSRMPQLLQALSRRVGQGVVIFDSPPLLATNEAQVATRYAGQVLVVVRAEETPQQAVLDALALVDKDVPVSAVLNRCQPSLLSRYYGRYYYSGGYGGYGYHRSPPGQARKGSE